MVIKEKELLDEPVVYFSKWRNHVHTVRNPREIVIDGKVVKIPGVRLKFTNNKATVRDVETLELMEEQLNDPKVARIIHRSPSSSEIKRSIEVAKEIEAAKKKIIEKHGPPTPKPSESFADYLKKTKIDRDTTYRKGMVGVTTPNAPQSS